MHFNNEDVLESEVTELQAENAYLQSDNVSLAAQANETATENYTLRNEDEQIKREADGFLLQNDRPLQEPDNSPRQEVKLTQENTNLLQQNERLKRENDSLSRQNNCLERENESLSKQNDRIRQNKDSLLQQIRQLTREKESLLQQNRQLTRERDNLLQAGKQTALLVRSNKALKDENDYLRKSVQAGWQQRDALKEENQWLTQIKSRLDNELSLKQAELREKESIVDVIPVMRNAILPFVEKMLYSIHQTEDENQIDSFLFRYVKGALHKFLLQTLNTDGIEVVFSEAEIKGRPFGGQRAEIIPVLTDNPAKDGTLYRTRRPGIMVNGETLICEQVEVWRYPKK